MHQTICKRFILLIVLIVPFLPVITGAGAPPGAGAAKKAGDEKAAGSADGTVYTVITWNISKNDARNKEVKRLIRQHRPDILCLQEATSRTCEQLQSRFFCHFAPSWKAANRDIHNGVLTASRHKLQAPARFESPDREFVFATTKAAMVSTVAVDDAADLMVINVHMLNFVGIGAFNDQLEEIFQHARDHTGPMIWCGDFNTWNSARLKAVHQYAARLGMVEALAYHESGGTPSKWTLLVDPFIEIHQGALLDRIFCRGFEVLECKRLSGFETSDHPPMLLRARVLD
ncbi:MAG: endonuclease/exonuclease/phosphatase family protein [Thermodesulfobacteriota bacterium]